MIENIYKNIYIIAAEIISENGENPEFDRGVFNFLAEIDPVMERTVSERMLDVEQTVRYIKSRMRS